MSIAEAILAARQWMREPDRGVDKPGRKDQIVPSNFGNQRMANDMCPQRPPRGAAFSGSISDLSEEDVGESAILGLSRPLSLGYFNCIISQARL